MTELSPADVPLIRALCDGVRQFARFDMSVMYQVPKPLMGPRDWLTYGRQMWPFVPALAKWAWQSTRDFAQKFQDKFLQRAVAQMFSWEEAPVMMGMMLLAYMHTGNAGFPVGASLALARAVEKRYLDLEDLELDPSVESRSHCAFVVPAPVNSTQPRKIHLPAVQTAGHSRPPEYGPGPPR